MDKSFTDDFLGLAESTHFTLGSLIPIMARVEQSSHQPLLLLLDDCIAVTTPEVQSGSNTYPIITNKGYEKCQQVLICSALSNC